MWLQGQTGGSAEQVPAGLPTRSVHQGLSTAASACEAGTVHAAQTQHSRNVLDSVYRDIYQKVILTPRPISDPPCREEDPPLDDSFLAGIKEACWLGMVGDINNDFQQADRVCFGA